MDTDDKTEASEKMPHIYNHLIFDKPDKKKLTKTGNEERIPCLINGAGKTCWPCAEGRNWTPS